MEYQAFHASPWTHGSFWVFVAIVIFVVVVGRKLLAAVTGMLDKRTQSVRDALEEAAQVEGCSDQADPRLIRAWVP